MPKLTQEQKRELYLPSDEGGRRSRDAFGFPERRSERSRERTRQINQELAEARKELRAALKEAKQFPPIPQEMVNEAKAKLKGVEGARELEVYGRQDDTAVKNRSGLDRRSRGRRIGDPEPGPHKFFNPSLRVTDANTVIDGRRSVDPKWLIPGKQRLSVAKDSLQQIAESPVMRKMIRGAKPIIKTGLIADMLLNGDPLDSEIAGDIEPGGPEALFAAELRGESMANQAIRNQLREAIAIENGWMYDPRFPK